MHALRTAGIVHRHRCKAARAALNKRITDLEFAAGTCAGFSAELCIKRQPCGFQGFHKRICDSVPPTRNAPTHVPNHTIMASFVPRSFSITIREAIQGTNSVIVTRATTI